MCHERPPIPLPRCDTVPLTGATVGVPRGESMSTPLWARPPERAAPQVLLKATGPCTGHTTEPVAIGVAGAEETGPRPGEPRPDLWVVGRLACASGAARERRGVAGGKRGSVEGERG